MKAKKLTNHRMWQRCEEGLYQLRLWQRAGRTPKHSPRLRVKCGCCEKTLDIYHDAHGLEIGGVHASLSEWRKVLLPLLEEPVMHASADAAGSGQWAPLR